MAALKPTDFIGTIIWLGRVANRETALDSAPLPVLMARFAGPEAEAHGGLTRPSCSRVLAQYKRNTEIRNTRQFSILGDEDLAAMAVKMGLGSLNPALLGANMVIAGIPDFSHIPPSSRLQAEGGATLVVDMENRPCSLPARSIEMVHPGFGKACKSAAAGKRGITAWVEAEGLLRVGDKIRLHIPDQPVWAHLAAARRGKSE